MVPNRKTVPSPVWHGLVATCAILAVLSACLIVTVVLIARHRPWQESATIKWDRAKTNISKLVSKMEPWESNNRIPQTIQPKHYNILLHPDLSVGTFSGVVDVTVDLTGPTNYLPIHVKALNITSTKLYRNDTEVAFKSAFYSPKNMFWVVVLPTDSPLQAGSLRISMIFNGVLTGKIVGFYMSTYNSSSGKPRSIATSKFEPVDARAAFPCFDEPGLKATFTVSLVRPKTEYSALSNMNIDTEVDGPGANEVTVKFKTSVKMSSYLVCFIVSDFASLGPSNIDNDGTPLPIEVYTTPQQTANSKFASQVAIEVTQFYLKYFNIPYPLPKLDLIAIPDFVSGAMEHWGLITFRETAILFDEATNSASAQKRVAQVVAHEIAHQWFGNLVTMAWWDDLWLNEGFASFMETKSIADGVAKDWAILEQVVYDDIQPVMVTDAAVNSHPIVQAVSNPDQINQLFDSVSYDKGQSVLRMLEDFLEPNIFQRGLQTYLSANQFANARTEDLWQHLNTAYNNPEVDVSDVMNTWTRQMGYPVVHVQRENDKIILTQNRFLSDKDAAYDEKESPYKYKWDIPIKYVTSVHPTSPSMVWFRRSMSQLEIPILASTQFVKLNYRQTGFYRVNYEKSEWNALTANIQKFSPLDRAHLLNDVINLASAGYTEYANALDMISALSSETEYLPWAAGLDGITYLDLLLSDSPAYPLFRKFALQLISKLYGSKFDWTVPAGDKHLNRLLRVKILSASCLFGHPACIKDVGELFQKWLNDPTTPISPDLRSIVFIYGVSTISDEADWEKTWNIYLKETNAQERINLLTALSYVKEPWLIEKFLNLAWDEANVRSQDYFNVLGDIANTPVGSPIVWDYYRAHWPDLVARFGLQHRYLGSCILKIISRFTSQTRLDELRAFYAKYPEAGAGEASRRNAEEKLVTRIKWADKNAGQIGDWLA